MTIELKVHPSFFKEFATKTWVSPSEIIKELIENSFDEDATKVLITLFKNGSICIEDDAGMSEDGMEKFLLLGSPHKKIESISPKFKRIRTGRYGTGRLSFLTSFEKMKLKTRKGNYNKSIIIDESSLNNLFTGNSVLNEIKEKHLLRNGTELSLYNAKMSIDPIKLAKEIRKLAILRQPMFQVFIKQTDDFHEWDFDNAEPVKAQEIQGYRIPISLDDGRIIGEIIVARRPLTEEEKGIGIMIGNHIVVRSNFGLEAKLNRITGLIRCDNLTSRFADKSAIIEDDYYDKFYKIVKQFIVDEVIPKLAEYEDVLITKEESRIYKEIDKVLGQAVVENLESIEVEDYETITTASTQRIDVKSPFTSNGYDDTKSSSIVDTSKLDPSISVGTTTTSRANQNTNKVSILEHQTTHDISYSDDGYQGRSDTIFSPLPEFAVNNPFSIKKIKTLKRTFALKKIGYKVIPYEDASDSRDGFTNESIVFINKANSAYKAESERGDEFLLRHIIRIVAEAIAEEKHPEGKDALELQNRLIAEAIKIHNLSSRKK
ncbi:MAG TPA: ATP-binding protein [Nitrososphaeraceae archaeon]|nr:ATP-binding protein [Nitrososphaeraceae archaeon]